MKGVFSSNKGKIDYFLVFKKMKIVWFFVLTLVHAMLKLISRSR